MTEMRTKEEIIAEIKKIRENRKAAIGRDWYEFRAMEYALRWVLKCGILIPYGEEVEE